MALYQRVRCKLHIAVRTVSIFNTLSRKTTRKTTNWPAWLGYKPKTHHRKSLICGTHLVSVQHQCSSICCLNLHPHLLLSAFYISSCSLSVLCFSIGQTFTFHGTRRATPGFRTCVSLPIWYGCQISSSTTGSVDTVASSSPFVSSPPVSHLIPLPLC